MKLIMNKMRPIHPGEVLREEFLAPLKMNVSALAVALRVPRACINNVVRKQRRVSPEIALRLARYFGSTARFWLELQASFDLKIAEAEAGKRIKSEVQPMLPETGSS